MDLPEGVALVEVLALAPEDFLVVSVETPMSAAAIAGIAEQFRAALGHEKICVLPHGMRLSILKKERHSCTEAVAELGTMMKNLAP